MDGNPTSALKRHEFKSMREKEPPLSLNGDAVLASGYVMNGYSGKSADNDGSGSGSESGYTMLKKRRARRSSVKGPENAVPEKEKAAKTYSKQNTLFTGKEMPGKAVLNCTRACLKTEVRTGLRRTGIQDSAELQHRNSDSKRSVSVSVAKKTDEKVNKTKPVSSVRSKEDSWTLFKPPPVFPVDNSSAKIVPKISYASKVKENLNKVSTAESAQASGKLSHVPMTAVKTVTSPSFASIPASVDANGCYSVETSFSSAAGVSVAPSASSGRAEEDVECALDNGCSSPSRLSAIESQKSSLFVYPHKPLNMQPPAARTNQKALGDIFQNQWGLSFINEPNAGPKGVPASRPAAPLEISDITFQGGNFPFIIQPSLNAVSLPAPQDVQRRSNATNVAVKASSSSRTASQDCPHTQPACQEECKVEDMRSDNVTGSSKTTRAVKEHDGADGWGWADVQAAVLYHTKEFEYLLTLHEHDPERVMYYEEVMDGPDH